MSRMYAYAVRELSRLIANETDIRVVEIRSSRDQRRERVNSPSGPPISFAFRQRKVESSNLSSAMCARGRAQPRNRQAQIVKLDTSTQILELAGILDT